MYRLQWIQYAWSYCELFLLKDASCSQYLLEIHFFFLFKTLHFTSVIRRLIMTSYGNAAWHSSQSVWVYTVYISETLLQCNNRAQWIPYWSWCKKTNWKHLFTILLDHHGVFSGSSKLKKKNPGYGIKERQLLVCLFSWVYIRLYSPIKGLPINS